MRSLLKFFALTYIVSWILWIVVAAILHRTASQPSGFQAISGFLYLLGVFTPALMALALTARADGRAGTLALLRRTVKWSVGARWYVFAVGYMAAIKLAAALVLERQLVVEPFLHPLPLNVDPGDEQRHGYERGQRD